MATNEEIMEESRYYPVLKESDDEMAKVCVRDMLNEARSDTAKQIFAELEPIIQTLDVNDQNCLKVIIALQALKKRYGVD